MPKKKKPKAANEAKQPNKAAPTGKQLQRQRIHVNVPPYGVTKGVIMRNSRPR